MPKRRIALIGLIMMILPLLMGAAAPAGGETVSRAQAATSLLLSRSAALPSYDSGKQFADLPADAWFDPYMRAAEHEGIVEADSEHRVFPEEAVTRAEYLTMLSRTFRLPENLPTIYTDVPSDAWYAKYVGIATQWNLFPHDPDSFALSPNQLLTQQEASHALEVILKSRGLFTPEAIKRSTQGTPRERMENDGLNDLQLYLVVSTKRLKVTFEPSPKEIAKAPPPAPAPPPEPPKSIPEMRMEMMMLVNNVRTAQALRPLRYSTRLETSAQSYAEDMVSRGYFNHTSPEGETLKERMERAGYRNRTFSADCFCVKGYLLAENLVRGARTSRDAMMAWMESPAHRAAILSSDYKEVGFGIRDGMWVQHFGTVLIPTHAAATEEIPAGPMLPE
ncbi:CAP domain-containing protein [Candidatus Peregrinibacteria bacterium]|nr:CAP domain-containing protein [Candidatus Peregrinibacteria bacterium]